MGVLVTPKFKAKRVNVPMPSGRIVTFNDNEPQCVTDEEAEHLQQSFDLQGDCDSTKIEKLFSSPLASRSCGEGVRMQCDFETVNGRRVCIRCNREDKINVTFRNCSVLGYGDRLKKLIEWTGIPKRLGFGDCHSCSERRRWLNQFDRTRYRKRWEKKHGNTVSSAKARVFRPAKGTKAKRAH